MEPLFFTWVRTVLCHRRSVSTTASKTHGFLLTLGSLITEPREPLTRWIWDLRRQDRACGESNFFKESVINILGSDSETFHCNCNSLHPRKFSCCPLTDGKVFPRQLSVFLYFMVYFECSVPPLLHSGSCMIHFCSRCPVGPSSPRAAGGTRVDPCPGSPVQTTGRPSPSPSLSDV